MARATTKTKTKAAPKVAPMKTAGPVKGQEVAIAIEPTQKAAPPPRKLTAAEEAKLQKVRNRDYLLDMVRSERQVIEGFLRPLGVEWDFFMSALIAGMQTTMAQDADFFGKVTPESFISAVVKCAKDGLIPDGKEAAIGRFAETATYMPMVKGIVKIMWATGLIAAINHNVVVEGDQFEFEEGSDPFVRHIADLNANPNDNTKSPLAAWCTVKMKEGGEIMVEIVRRAELLQMARMSKSEKGPRGAWGGQMHRKGAVRRMIGRLPPHPRLTQLLDHDNENYLDTPRPVEIEDRRAAAARDMTHDDMLDDTAATLPKDEEEMAQIQAWVDAALKSLKKVKADSLDLHVADLRKAPEARSLSEEQGKSLQTAIAAAKKRLEPKPVRDKLDCEHQQDHAPPQDDHQQDVSGERVEADRVPSEDPPRLRAWLSSSSKGATIYDDPKEWLGDMLNRLTALKSDALSSFWSRNTDYVEEARVLAPEQVERVLDIAKQKGLLRGN